MRKLWVKAWITLDGVFDADTMDYWWQNTNSPERMRYITEEYSKGDAYRFLVQPFIMGRGRRFFPDGTPPTTLKLVEGKTLGFGSLALVFRPADE